MSQIQEKQPSPQEQKQQNNDAGNNLLRTLTMVKKAIGRLVRRTYSRKADYPKVFDQLEDAIARLRAWIRTHRRLTDCVAFQVVLGDAVNTLGALIARVQDCCRPSVIPEKRQKSRRYQSYRKVCRAITTMLVHLGQSVPVPRAWGTSLGVAFAHAFQGSLDRQTGTPEIRRTVSQRGDKTYIFPCAQVEAYLDLVDDHHRFWQEVVVDWCAHLPHPTGHHAGCPDSQHYTLSGFRPQPRKVRLPGGRQQACPIRMITCRACGAHISLLPSFLAREKHFSLEIIGHIVKKLTLRGQSLRASLEDLEILSPGGHSPQTLQDWLDWVGTLHPSDILTRTGIEGSGYFQEDEGFENESGLRTYTVAMVDPHTLLVWHLDYVDQVDEDTLVASFDAFVQHLSFKVLGVTKDKWQPSTQALKRVCHALWIEFCHRHWLKKFRQALSDYQTATQCSTRERQQLYQQVSTILETAESGVVLRLRLNALSDEAFQHPLLRVRLDDLKATAVRYTSHHKRRGLTKTTSIVDNFLKLVKRKLRQVESFRDQACTKAFFRAMATVRNFVPFGSGAKHAHNSPFMLAQGETYGLPWMQVLNVHNAFLFTAGIC